LPEKKVLETGLVYFDYLQQSIEVKTNTKDKKTILVAPTWGDGGLFNKYGFSFVEDMAKENYNIILRPHPQSYVNDIELMNEVELRASKFSNISIDKRSTAIESMQNADLMISDISGIIFDFAFSLQKPIITFSDYSFDESRMLEINDVSSYTGASPKIWEMEVIKDITIQVKQANSKEILATIEELVTNPEKLNEVKKNILKVKEEYVFNYGKAGEVVAKQIEDILENGVKNTK
jgi:CDP-glycerol glycerophosphotransferase (TagB/SpsB family)